MLFWRQALFEPAWGHGHPRPYGCFSKASRASLKLGAWTSLCREEHSMDQYWSRLKLSENFERHWSIRTSWGNSNMDQSLVHTTFPGEIRIWTNGPESSSKVSPYPLTRNYCEKNSLRIIFRNFRGKLHSQNLQERKTFSRNYAWNS